jgi:hypothetical protein
MIRQLITARVALAALLFPAAAESSELTWYAALTAWRVPRP